jgi:hypothetical protein
MKKLDWMTILKISVTILTALGTLTWWGWGMAMEHGVKEYKSTATRTEVRQHRKSISRIEHDIADLKIAVTNQTQSLRLIKKKLKIEDTTKIVRR